MKENIGWLEYISKEDMYDLKNIKVNNREDFFKAFYGLYNQKIVIKDPFKIHLEVTNHCNLKCRMCPRDKMTRAKGFIDKNLAFKIIDDGARNNLYHLSLFLHGEPLLHPDIIEIAEYSKKMNIPSVNITTNGILLDKTKAEAILKTGIDTLVISLSAVSKENYIKMIGTEKQYSTVVENTMYICKRKKELGLSKPFIRINAISNPNIVSESDKHEFTAEWEDLVDNILLSNVGTYGYGNKYCQLPDDMEKYRIPCRQLWRHFGILWNGDISPCCVDINGEVNLGNIKGKTLKEIWNCKEYNRLRVKHILQELDDYKMCKQCIRDWNF